MNDYCTNKTLSSRDWGKLTKAVPEQTTVASTIELFTACELIDASCLQHSLHCVLERFCGL
jgi:hypothetical protein